jgi:hypothetical protein
MESFAVPVGVASKSVYWVDEPDRLPASLCGADGKRKRTPMVVADAG